MNRHADHRVVQDAHALAEQDDHLLACQEALAAIVHVKRLEGPERDRIAFEYLHNTPLGTLLNIYAASQKAPSDRVLEAFQSAIGEHVKTLKYQQHEHLDQMVRHLNKRNQERT